MKPVARYTGHDLQALAQILPDSPSGDTLPDCLVSNGHVTTFIKEGRQYEKHHALNEFTRDKQPTQFLKAWVRKILERYDSDCMIAFEIFSFLFHVPFESVPLFMNDETLNYFGLIKWRLSIGK